MEHTLEKQRSIRTATLNAMSAPKPGAVAAAGKGAGNYRTHAPWGALRHPPFAASNMDCLSLSHGLSAQLA
jgi:hypothetical protein